MPRAKPARTISQLEAELARRTVERDDALAREAAVTAERDQALAQQTATAEVLGVINSSPGDLAPVFDAMLERALRLCEAAFGNLWVVEGDTLRLRAEHNMPRQILDYMQREVAQIRPDTSVGRAILTRSVIHLPDIRQGQLYRQGASVAVAAADLGGIRTILWVPLVKDDRGLGVITVYRREVRPFSDKQIALLQNFAAQAVIAMENARLLTETHEALEQQTATSDILRTIAAAPGEAEGTLRQIAETTARLFAASGVTIRIAEGDEYAVTIHVGRGAEDLGAALATGAPRQAVLPRSLPGAVLRENRQIHLPDLDDLDPEMADWPGTRVLRAGGARTLVGTPLRREGRAVGSLNVWRDELRPFSASELQLLQSFADQAAIAIENARLITETREALEQQTATAEVLGVINSSPGDLAPVFDAMLDRALQLCDAALGTMLTWDGEQFHRVALRGASAELAAALRQPIRPVPGSVGERVVRGERTIRVSDLRDEEGYRAGGPGVRALVDIGGVRSYALVTLRKDEALLGEIAVYRQEVRPFSDQQIALLQNFAAQAVIAMENARLITETREALEQQTATAEVLGVINASPGNLGPVFDAMLDKALRLCGAAFGTLWTFDGQAFRAAALRRVPKPYADFLSRGPIRPTSRSTGLGRLIDGGAGHHILDMVAEPYKDSPGLRAAVELGGVRTVASVPLRRDSALLGAITIYRQEVQPFTEKQIALLQNFAAQAVVAIENARLLGELRQRTEEVAELNRGLEARVAEQVEELGRVGRLKRFLAPQLAELIVSQGDEKILESHRRDIVVVFCDLRGYTAFTETAEPEEVLDFLREYHGALGPLVSQFEGTLDQFSGDGIMVFFNDPVPIPDPAERAVRMAVAMREAAGSLVAAWRRRGRELGFGAGIAQGYATLGQIGFSERSGYTAIGTVCNVAARLCAEAKDGQILLSQRVAAGLDGNIVLQEIGPLVLKGLTQPVVAYNVPLVSSQAALRVIEGGPSNNS